MLSEEWFISACKVAKNKYLMIWQSSLKQAAFEKFIRFFYHFYLENIEIASEIISVYYQRQGKCVMSVWSQSAIKVWNRVHNLIFFLGFQELQPLPCQFWTIRRIQMQNLIMRSFPITVLFDWAARLNWWGISRSQIYSSLPLPVKT